MHSTSLIAILVLVTTACGDDGTTPVDGGSDAGRDAAGGDAGGDDAGGGDAGEDDAGGDDAGAACAGERPDVSAIRGTEGIVIARDGTIYYSQMGGVGRLVPGGTPEGNWARLGDARITVWGLTLDAANSTLFVGVPGQGVFAIDLSVAVPAAMPVMAGGQPNGVAMGPDGYVYYSDFGGGTVRRVRPDGSGAGTVSTSNIAGANGVAFEADGSLLVASYNGGTLLRLTLKGGVETDRDMVAGSLGNPDGVAVDATGRIYVTDNGGGRLLRMESDGSGVTPLAPGIPAAASLEFGTGPLDCEDLYVTSSGPLVRYEMGDTAGAAVPWH